MRKFAAGTSLSEDWEQATVFLLQKEYFCNTITAPGRNDTTIHGLVFAHPERLTVLTKRGFLTIFDSTNKFNVHWYNLFTFMCRNQSAIWIPGAYCLLEVENSDILSTALQYIYRWNNSTWKMHYPLTDNSAIEKAAVKKAFGAEGHIKTHLLCTVHSERTLSRRFRSLETKDAFNHMRHAMRVITEEKCVALCQEAINSLTFANNADRRYIEREWLNTRQE
jgi:hypothetical protein